MAEDSDGYLTPDPEGAAIGRIPLRRKRISKVSLKDREHDDTVDDLPERPQLPVQAEVPYSSEARRALEQENLLAAYGRPVVHDLSVPGLDPPPLPVDSQTELRLPNDAGSSSEDLAPSLPEESSRKRPAEAPPRRAHPRREPLEVSMPAAGLERHTTDSDSAIMVFVPDLPVKDEEPGEERIGGGQHRRSRPTVPMKPGERPRVRRPTEGQGSARTIPQGRGHSGALAWVLFVVGLLAALTLYLILVR